MLLQAIRPIRSHTISEALPETLPEMLTWVEAAEDAAVDIVEETAITTEERGSPTTAISFTANNCSNNHLGAPHYTPHLLFVCF